MMVHEALLQKLTPDADRLLSSLSKLVDDDMLMEIANIDYGEDVNLHLEQLLKIRDEQAILTPMMWYPREVLNLTRWDQPAKDDEKSIMRRHLIRAFACTVLLRMNVEPLNSQLFDGEVDDIARLLDSLPVFAPSIQEDALHFFAWRTGIMPALDSENPFWVIGLLILVLRMPTSLTSAEIHELIQWVYEEVDMLREYPEMILKTNMNDDWLTWLTYYKQSLGIWQDLGQELAKRADEANYADNQQELKALARHLENI